ncbi:MAG: hypothetical protein RL664_1817 [Bacteroidota bacterium]|jgi:hypothetical protein
MNNSALFSTKWQKILVFTCELENASYTFETTNKCLTNKTKTK